MKEFSISEEKLMEAYRLSDDDGKRLIITLFGKEVSEALMHKVKNFFDVCDANGVNFLWHRFEDGEPHEIAYFKLVEIFKAVRGPIAFDFLDPNQEKWYPNFKMVDGNFTFSHSACEFTIAGAVGARLSMPTKGLSDYVGKQFIHEFKSFLI